MARIVFIQNLWREYFGVMSLAAALKRAGHEAEVVIGHNPDQAADKALSRKPDAAAFSFTQCEEAFALAAACAVKRLSPKTPALAGGIHPSLSPERVAGHGVDFVCRGEGEAAILRIAETLDAGGDLSAIPNLAFRRDGELIQNPVAPLIEDLDALPFPDREIYYRYSFLRANPVRYFFTGRGCPYNCSFCFNSAARLLYPNPGRWVRRRSVENVLREMEEVLRRRPARFVRFEDDVFTLHAEWTASFLDGYRRRIGLPFMCYLRAGEKEETIRLLAESGCHSVLFGIETGDEARRNELLGKNLRDEQIRSTARLLHAHGIHMMTTNMLGLPRERFEDALATLRLNQGIGVRDAWCSMYQPYAGLPLTSRARREGLLGDADEGRIGINIFTDNSLANPDARRIANLQKLFYPLARWPRLTPLLLPLTKLPPNALFRMIFVAFFVYSYRQHTVVGFARLVREGVMWFRQFRADRVREL